MSFNLSADHDDDGLSPLAEINVTPMVDVMLVLLIIFMVAAPMLSSGMKVDLPQAKSAEPTDPKNPIVLTIAADRKISIGADEVQRADLIPRLRSMIGEEDRIVHVRGDRTASYGDIVSVLDELALNGITRLSLIANKSSTPQAAVPQAPAPQVTLPTAATP
ncbi:ExbD/TolR family protein [Taklimakanibacter lacteus]|uniref:ExbD/TolR family protein n=1 Tax=Taklimakanibacter lacteus TaxID=2268456 RepID=UPI000E66C35E